MRLSATTTAFLFAFTVGAMAAVFARPVNTARDNYYPVCSDIAHEIQGSWQRGELTRNQAERLIENCLKWEDKQ